MNIKKLFSACLIVCVSVLAYGESAPVKIGWAMESIDPGRSSVMPGYGSFRYSYGCADPIYATCLVLDNGKVIGAGRHEQPMQCCEEYRIIAETQMGDGKEAV